MLVRNNEEMFTIHVLYTHYFKRVSKNILFLNLKIYAYFLFELFSVAIILKSLT